LVFFKKHLILTNLLLAVLIACVLVFVLIKWLDVYTHHGSSVEIPDVKGLKIEDAAPFFQSKDLNYAVVDSIYVKNAVPGTILETIPPMGSSVKRGRTIYITVNSVSSKNLTIPDVINMSQRQGISMLKSIGFESITIKLVPGAFSELVVGLESHGRELSVGDKLASHNPLTLLISSGTEETTSETEEDILTETEEESWF
jgi:beta-lactam-binding protein with PASTA domain